MRGERSGGVLYIGLMEDHTTEARPYSSVALIRDLWGFLGSRRWMFVIACVLAFASTIVWLYPPYAMAQLVNILTGDATADPLRAIWIIFILWALASVWHYGSEQIVDSIANRMAERTALDMQLSTIRHLLRLDLTWHEKENAGAKLKRIQRGVDGINRMSRIWFRTGIPALVRFVGMIPILAAFDLRVGLATLFFLITYFALSSVLTGRAGRAEHIVNTTDEHLQGVVFEGLSNVRSVKVLGMQEGLLGIIAKKIENLYLKIRIRIRRFRVRNIILNLWSQTFRVGIMFVIALDVYYGRRDIGFLVLFYNYFNYIWESIQQLSDLSLDFIVAKYGVSRMRDILNEPVGIDRNRGKQAFPASWESIDVQNLTFSYGEQTILDSISFSIRRGERIGIVGVSGAGKSTLFKLLLKEHENYDGQITIGGVALRDIRRADFFQKTAVVLQDTEVFNFRLVDNITLANIASAEDQPLLQQAVETAHVSDFMDRLPDGLDTIIGEKGIKLSGGEKQRVGIARAVFKQPEILFLDEATSHLDLESEAKIRDSLHRFFQNVTAVVIAHRLTTIREMDRILVLEDGKIIESGPFDALIAKKGRFFDLWEQQKF